MDGFSQYIQGITRYPLLTKDQEILLARQVQTWLSGEDPTPRQQKMGQRAYQKLINCNLRLVVSIAKRYVPRARRTELFDIVQEGNIGLAHGVKKFDPERGYALSTYVYWWIRQAITRYLSYHDRMIRLPSHAVEMLAKLRNWKPQFLGIHGRLPTLEECAEYCNTTPKRLRDYLERGEDCLSLDRAIMQVDSDVLLIDSITDADALHPMERLDTLLSGDAVDRLLATLDPTDRIIVERVFAVNGGEPETYLKVAKDLGMSRERARQRCQRALTKLRCVANQGAGAYV
jgi:RNA polymerase nonessential primary-like sigma factor